MYLYEEKFIVYISLEDKDPEPCIFNFLFSGPHNLEKEEYIHGRKIKGKTILTVRQGEKAITTYSIISPDEEVWNPVAGIRTVFNRAMKHIAIKEAKEQIGMVFPLFLDRIKQEYKPVPFEDEELHKDKEFDTITGPGCDTMETITNG